MSMEIIKGIDFGKVIKRAGEISANMARAAEKERQAENEEAQVNQHLQTLRANISLEGINFQDQNALEDLLSEKDYLAQMITLEKAAEAGAVTPQQMIDLFGATHDNKTRLAVIENLPKLKKIDPEQQKVCLHFLSQIAVDYFSDPEEETIEFNLSKEEEIYLEKYRLDSEEGADLDLITTAAIKSLSQFGKEAEGYLLDVLKNKLGMEEQPDEREAADPENHSSDEYDDSLFDYLDKDIIINDSGIKALFDEDYYYNSLILQKLAEMGSRKGVDFLAESMPENNDPFNIIYYLETTELLASMLRDAKATGEKIDYEKAKFLKLYEKPIGEDLPDEEKNEILKIADENYFNDVYRDNPEAAQRVIDELEGELFGIDGLKKQRTYTLKYQGRVIAFCRFEPIEGKPDELYAGSLNVYKDLRGLSVGGYFVRATTGKEAKNHILRAITRKDNVANESYKKCGWVIDEEDSSENNGVKYFNMMMDRRERNIHARLDNPPNDDQELITKRAA